MTEPTPTQSDGRRPAGRSRAGRVAHLAGSMYFVTAITLVTSPIVARALGPEGRGEYAAAYVWGLVAFTLLGGGIPAAVLNLAGKQRASESQLLAAVLRIAAVLAVPTVALAVLVSMVILGDLRDETRIAAFGLVMLAPLRTIGQSLRAMLIARSELLPMTIVGALPALVTVAGASALAIAGELTLGRYLALTFVVEAVAPLVWWVAIPVRPRGPSPVRRVASFAYRSQLGYVSEFSARRLDQAVLAAIVAPAQLGYYAVAATVSALPAMLGNAVATRTYLGLERGQQRDDMDGTAARSAGRTFRELCAGSMIAALAIAAVAPWAIPLLWGDAFGDAVPPLLLLLPGSVALALMGLCRNYLIILDRPGAMSIAQLLGALVTVVGLLVFTPTWGIHAAAVVSSLSYIVIVAAMLFVMRDQRPRPLVPGVGDVRSVVGFAARQLPWLPRAKAERPCP